MVHGQSLSLEDMKVIEQMLVILEEIKRIANQLQADYMIFKPNLKDSFE